MIKRILTIAFISAALIGNTSCGSNSGGGFKKVKGIEYKIIKDAPGKNAQIGDIVEFHIFAKADTTVLADSRKQQNNKPAVIRVEDTKLSGQFQSIFPLLSVGDSALIEISCDTMLAANPPQGDAQLPPWLKKGKKIMVTIVIESIKSEAEMKKDIEQKSAQQMSTDDKILQEYLAKNNINATKTASGLYYTITKEGSGPTAKAGQSVTMNYTGKTLEGKSFDSNVDSQFKHVEPFKFTLGQGAVIKGWDEGVALLKKGSQAVFYIPSPLAYGPQSPSPDLAANSILIFNVEVLDIKDAAPEATNAPQAQ